MAIMALAMLALTACASRRSATLTESRHADSVATLAARSARSVERVEVWETLTMLPDTMTGELRVARRDVVRHAVTEAVSTADTAAAAVQVAVSSFASDTTETSNDAAADGRTCARGKALFVAAVWMGFAALAIVGAKIIIAKWT